VGDSPLWLCTSVWRPYHVIPFRALPLVHLGFGNLGNVRAEWFPVVREH
jgi:hypothetical protein